MPPNSILDGSKTSFEWQRRRPRLCVLPVGAFEQHSRHLPLQTDNFKVEYFARFIAGELNAALLPTLNYGTSLEQSGFTGTISLRSETLMHVIRDIAAEVEAQGFTEMILLNGHGGNFALAPAVRERLRDALAAHPDVRWAVVEVSAAEIDRVNILQATWLGMRRALARLRPTPDFAFVDGLPVPRLPCASRAVVQGDAKVAAVAAASIFAKVHRDALLVAADRQYPGYGFAQHKGYPTPAHLAALTRLGPCPLHRRSFAPVAAAANVGAASAPRP